MEDKTRRILQCRVLLAETTPLNSDCGTLCGAACCRSLEGEDTGMLLFPGEAALYADKPDFRLLETGRGTLLICPGVCDRADRPLACRLFPLLPLVRETGIRVAVDARARAVCPLRRTDACAERFVAAVRQAGEILADDPEQRCFLMELTREHDDLRAMQKRMGV